MKQRRYRDYYEENEEMYVYDQSCENCRYYCGWGEEGQRDCKFYTRDDYERFPKSHWCYQWKGIRKSQHGRHSGGGKMKSKMKSTMKGRGTVDERICC